nr:FecR domain-containing protein [Pseudomaricurvus alcaniphilus]
MACTLLLVFLSWQLELFGKTYVTPVGTQRTMTLADGSLMRMNTNTRIKVVYSGSTRLIVLQQGEAQFDVKKDNQRPFTVRVGEASVTAVGTAFNIDYSRDIADVLVTEGVVEINAAPPATNGFFTTLADRTPAPAASRISLSEGQSAKIDKSVQAVRQLQPEEIHRKLAWQKGMLMFNGERLAEVIEQVTRYTDTRIIIDDADIANIAIGGYFRTGDTHAMLDALQNSFDIKVTRVNPKLVLLGKNSQL